jgi:hypothetical protein
MVAVAIVGFLAAKWAEVERRRKEHSIYQRYHSAMRAKLMGPSPAISDYHRRMAEKHWSASGYPWFLVAPDPPEPE